MRFASLLLCALLLPLTLACPSRRNNQDDDGGSDGDGDVDAGDPCPESLCCTGKPCPGGFICDEERNTCVGDPCRGADCCEERPCEDPDLECVDGTCMPISTVGDVCGADDDCHGPGAECLFAGEGWPDGYCIQDCVGGTTCPGDAVCVGASCFDGCALPADCRIGYECKVIPNGQTCSPE